jgi:C1A family cysteine protease
MDGPSGLTPRNVQRYGWKPDLPDPRDLMFSAPQPVLASLPPKVDLRRGCPPVYDQGQLGSCTANAIGAAFQFAQRKLGLVDFTPSRLFIYYNEREMEGTIGEDSGAMIRDGIKSVNKLGVCDENTWKYNVARFTEQPDPPAYTEALRHQATSYRRVRPVLNQLKGCLAGGLPFVFGFSVAESFESPDVARTGEVPMPAADERILGGHAVLAAGYDDATQRFLVRNSWGEKWGKGGYCTMPYAYLTDAGLAQDFWAIYAVEAPA